MEYPQYNNLSLFDLSSVQCISSRLKVIAPPQDKKKNFAFLVESPKIGLGVDERGIEDASYSPEEIFRDVISVVSVRDIEKLVSTRFSLYDFFDCFLLDSFVFLLEKYGVYPFDYDIVDQAVSWISWNGEESNPFYSFLPDKEKKYLVDRDEDGLLVDYESDLYILHPQKIILHISCLCGVAHLYKTIYKEKQTMSVPEKENALSFFGYCLSNFLLTTSDAREKSLIGEIGYDYIFEENFWNFYGLKIENIENTISWPEKTDNFPSPERDAEINNLIEAGYCKFASKTFGELARTKSAAEHIESSMAACLYFHLEKFSISPTSSLFSEDGKRKKLGLSTNNIYSIPYYWLALMISAPEVEVAICQHCQIPFIKTHASKKYCFFCDAKTIYSQKPEAKDQRAVYDAAKKLGIEKNQLTALIQKYCDEKETTLTAFLKDSLTEAKKLNQTRPEYLKQLFKI